MDQNLTEGDLISIIMPAFNASAYIMDAISSVQQQSYRSWELIVIDDGSTDNTPSIVKELQKDDGRIIYHRQDNQRLGAARNTGFRLAKGIWVAFLDADDQWLEHKLKVQLRSVCSQKSDIDVVFTAGFYLHTDQPELRPYDSLSGCYSGKKLFKILLRHNYIPILSVIIKRAFCETIGLQDTAKIVYGNEDWDFWLRACKANGRFLGLEERLFKYRIHHSGMSANTVAMRTAACYVVSKNYDRDMLDPGDQNYHQTYILRKIPSIARSAFKAGTSPCEYCRLLVRMIKITLPLLAKPKVLYHAIRPGQESFPYI
jgi:glycosyltransferase involved in cell wall biosynthesis